MDKYVAYYRISKEGNSAATKEGRHLGLEAQQAIVRHYYGDSIIREFSEIRSAKNIHERPVLKKAMEFCLLNKAILVVAKIDRLSRNVEDTLFVWNKLIKKIRSCDFPGEIDKFSLTLYAAFAERERELISLRTSQALKAKKHKEGSWQKGNAKFKSGEMSILGIKAKKLKAKNNENNKRAKNYALTLRLQGLTLNAICDRLNTEGFKTSKEKQFNPIQVSRLCK